MSFGIKVFTKTGTAYNLDSKCTTMSIAGALGSNVYPETGLYVPEGYNYYAHLSMPCGFGSGGSDTAGGTYIDFSYDPIAYLDKKRQLCFRNGEYGRNSWSKHPDEVYLIPNQQLVLLTWPKSVKVGGHGILFNGVSSFFQINQNSNFTNVVWKGDIEISNQGWGVSCIDPSLSHYNSFVFFYCEDPTISIGRDFNNSQYDLSYVPYDHNGRVSNRTVKVKVVVFGVGQIKTSKFGLRIYKNKSVVYDSCNEIFINPAFTSFERYALGQWQSINGIRRPMHAMVSVGASFSNKKNQSWVCDIGVRSNGFQLSTSEQLIHKVFWLESELDFDFYISAQKVLVLDAENYFNF